MHHADLRLEGIRCATDKFRCSYFGDASAAMYLPDLVAAGVVDVIEATNRNGVWMSLLPFYDCHYAVRPQTMLKSVCKPFTKGLTAAAYGAVAIFDSGDMEAQRQLGKSYPFYVASAAGADDVIAFLKQVATLRGGPEWKAATASLEAAAEAAAPRRIRECFRDLLRSGWLFG